MAVVALANAGCSSPRSARPPERRGGRLPYYTAPLVHEYPAPYGDTLAAVKTSLTDLQFPIVKEQPEGGGTLIETRTGDGVKVRIALDVVTSPVPADGSVTKVSVRVGHFGDEEISTRIQDQIAHHMPSPPPLAGPGTAAPPPPKPGRRPWPSRRRKESKAASPAGSRPFARRAGPILASPAARRRGIIHPSNARLAASWPEEADLMPRRNLAWLLGVVALTCWARRPLQRPDQGEGQGLRTGPPAGGTLHEVRERYVMPVDEEREQQLVEDMINGGLERLDPHSQYINPHDYKQFNKQSEGKFGGVGIQVGFDRQNRGLLTVISPMAGTPAYEAGVLAGDIILKIDGKATDKMRMSEAVDMIQGDPARRSPSPSPARALRTPVDDRPSCGR